MLYASVESLRKACLQRVCVWSGQAFLHRTVRQCGVLFCTAGSPLLHPSPSQLVDGVSGIKALTHARIQRVRQDALDTIARFVKLVGSFSSLHFVVDSFAE